LSSLTLRSCATVVRAKRKRRDSKSSYDTVMQFYVQMIPRYKYSIQSHVFHSISDKYRHTDQTTSSKRSQLFFTASSNTTVTGAALFAQSFTSYSPQILPTQCHLCPVGLRPRDSLSDLSVWETFLKQRGEEGIAKFSECIVGKCNTYVLNALWRHLQFSSSAWHSLQGKFRLLDKQFEINVFQVSLCVEGNISSGKSTFLSEVLSSASRLEVCDSVCYTLSSFGEYRIWCTLSQNRFKVGKACREKVQAILLITCSKNFTPIQKDMHMCSRIMFLWLGICKSDKAQEHRNY
jgi:hypothetical protein